MGSDNIVLTFVEACTSGKLSFAECGPVWQFGTIAVLLVAAIVFLVMLTMRPQGQSTQG